MPEPDDALSGIKVDVKGPHTFYVTTQTKVIAKGKQIMVIAPGQTVAHWWGQDTGEEGQKVEFGFKVFVNDATVVLET